MSKFTNAEKLKVFISSAQNDENGFSWHETRMRIKEHLKKERILSPFIIEDECSTIPSTQFYQEQVLKSDIVVLLVKGEVRDGTGIEFALCAKNKIPLLAYFIHDSLPSLKVTELKKTIEKNDICTYCSVSDLSNIENRIKKDILNDVVRYFKGYKLRDSLVVPATEDSIVSIEEVDASFGIPGKTSLKLFKSCYNYFYKLLNIPILSEEDAATDVSEFHELGNELIDWLIKGDSIHCEDDILRLIESTKGIYKNTEWLKYRWDAIRFELAGESSRALESEQKALDLANEADFPQWIINNILVDCRNIEAEIEYINCRFPISRDAQEKLDSLETIVYLPTVDRYLNQIYSEITSEEFDETTSSYKTKRFSNRLSFALKELANYFFSSVLYGSYTHIAYSRNILSYILEKFSQFHNSPQLLFESVKLNILIGSSKDFLAKINAEWDKLYLNVALYADELWKLAQKTFVSHRDIMTFAVLQTVGLYLSDEDFIDAENYLYDFSNKVYWGNSENYFNCILRNIMRLNQDKLVCVLSDIISDQRFHLGDKISKIIINIEFKNVSENNLNMFNNVLMDHLPDIIKNNGDPQLISVLVRYSPTIFGDLESLPNNGLVGIERKYYDINIGLSNLDVMLADEIEFARKQFEHSKATGSYIRYGCSSYGIISRIIRKQESVQKNDISQTILEQFIPLAIDILNSNVHILIKEECVECLCDVLSFLLCQTANIPSDMIKAIQYIDTNKTSFMLSMKSEDTFPIKVLMVKIIVGLAGKNDLFSCCIGYNQKNIHDRLALATCLEKYLYRNVTNNVDVDVLLITLIAQCCDDDYYEIKSIGCKCVSYILSSGYNESFRVILEEKLIQHTMDSSVYVRSSILSLCESKSILGNLYNRLIEIFKNDANYSIRYRARTIDTVNGIFFL